MKIRTFLFSMLLAFSAGSEVYAKEKSNGSNSPVKAEEDNQEKNREISTGSKDREAVRKVIRDHLSEIRKCYYDVVKEEAPDLYGKVVIVWDIGDGGIVTKASVTHSLHPKVDQRIVDAIKSWKFPAPPADQTARISYPFVFSDK